jgi:hypothetical protein
VSRRGLATVAVVTVTWVATSLAAGAAMEFVIRMASWVLVLSVSAWAFARHTDDAGDAGEPPEPSVAQ